MARLRLAQNQQYFLIVLLCLLIAHQLYHHDIWQYLMSLPFGLFHYPLDIDLIRLVDKISSSKGPQSVHPINEVKYPLCWTRTPSAGMRTVNRKIYFSCSWSKSKLDNFEQRRMIRRTWGLETAIPYVQIRRLFLLGVDSHDKALQHRIGLEYQDYNDMMQQFFHDHYFNNTLKMMMGFQWAVHHCPGAQFVAFFDDDYYVNTYNLVRPCRLWSPHSSPTRLSVMCGRTRRYSATSISVTGHSLMKNTRSVISHRTPRLDHSSCTWPRQREYISPWSTHNTYISTMCSSESFPGSSNWSYGTQKTCISSP